MRYEPLIYWSPFFHLKRITKMRPMDGHVDLELVNKGWEVPSKSKEEHIVRTAGVENVLAALIRLSLKEEAEGGGVPASVSLKRDFGIAVVSHGSFLRYLTKLPSNGRILRNAGWITFSFNESLVSGGELPALDMGAGVYDWGLTGRVLKPQECVGWKHHFR